MRTHYTIQFSNSLHFAHVWADSVEQDVKIGTYEFKTSGDLVSLFWINDVKNITRFDENVAVVVY